ncbi:helix-turn-helix domain-containing protein [Actinokineospora xionganensis]|uniref:Helix-turn-helix transcriptional regulator n=1 Tax=Actinokineospora xionganensis TaxID=2684470 RepID=A0ABR7LDT1_9PSEU|nr:helix-turn-helix transcriptional regulator [Actinokineospora xionganensis]MBC6450868.1 helix-turn-helix transcriptional regulator [Actinokineospora xionganensis]
MTGRIDVVKLYEALDAQRRALDLSWRQAAQQAGVSPSLLSRMGNGQRPDLDGFVALVQWLGEQAETFMISPGEQETAQPQPDFNAQFAMLLRAQPDFSASDKQYLKDIVEATVRKVKADREGR